MNETPNLLDPYHFYFELPLYTKIEITSENESNFEKLALTHQFSISAYSPALKSDTTYTIGGFKSFTTSHRFGEPKTVWDALEKNMYVSLQCQRNRTYFYVLLHIDKEKKVLQKVGQYPSIASFHIAKVKDYSKVLNKEKMKELTRAIGLAANGVGVGSYVYLRRIFEHLLEEAHQEAIKDADWDEGKYKYERVKENILMLKEHLPKFLIDNIALYGILSKGIHELEENECLAHFEAVRIGIELILDEKLNEYERKKKQEEATKKISAIASKLK